MGTIPPPNTGDLHVSVEDLDAAAAYVERLKQYIDDTISYEMERIKERMKGDSNNAQTVPNGTPFGAYEDARHAVAGLTTSTGNMEAHLTDALPESRRAQGGHRGDRQGVPRHRGAQRRQLARRSSGCSSRRRRRPLPAARPPTRTRPEGDVMAGGTWERCVREVTLSADPETVGSVGAGWSNLSTGLTQLRDALVGRSFVGPIAHGPGAPARRWPARDARRLEGQRR